MRGKTWYIDTIVGGRRIHRTTGCQEKAAAEAVESQARAAAEQALMGTSPPLKLRDAIEDLYTGRWSKTADGEQVYARLQKVADILGNPDLTSITAASIAELKTTLSSGRSPATVNRFLAPLKTLLRVAHQEWEVIDRVPLVKLDAEHGRRERVLDLTEEGLIAAQLRQAGRGDIADMMEVMLDTGLRPKELASVTDAMVDMAAKAIRLPGTVTKNHRPRVVPMTDRVFRILGSRVGNGRFFPVSKWVLDRAFKTAKEAAGIQDAELTPYICRHTAITRLLERGVDIYTVGQIAGHTTSGMTERYGHLCLDAKRRAIDTLNGERN